MQVRSGASARVSAQGNFLPLADLLSDADQNLAQVSIAGFSAIRMLNVNDVAIAAAPLFTFVPSNIFSTASLI